MSKLVINGRYQKIVDRFNGIMWDIGCEHLTIHNGQLSELADNPKYYSIENGVTVGWMLKEAEYWLSCYYEEGHCRCDDRFEGPEEYKVWRSETGKLKRLIEAIKKLSNQEAIVAKVVAE